MLEAIPQELRETPRWVAYRLVDRTPGEKLTKMPVCPHTGGAGSSTDPNTWGTFDEAQQRAEQDGLAGVGFVFTDDDDIVGVDLDKCRDPESGELDEWARDIVAMLDSYSELSPSGTGVHILARGRLPKAGRRKGDIEMYQSGRFFTMTGQHLEGTPSAVESRPEGIATLYREAFGESGQQLVRLDLTRPAAPPSDDELIERARRASNGHRFEALWGGDISSYPSQSEADLALCSMLAFWAGGDASQVDRLFRQSGLFRAKWDERRGEATYGERTVAKALEATPPALHSGGDGAGAGGLDPTLVRALTDTGNAERLYDLAADDLRFVHVWGKWLVWDGKRWAQDERGRALHWTKVAMRTLHDRAKHHPDPEWVEKLQNWARKSESRSKRGAMLELLQSEPGISVGVETFDADPWLLNCTNGTLDLRAGELRPHRRSDYITKLLPVAYDADATCPRWEAFLEHILPDPEVRSFVQRAVGYSLAGDVSEQVLLFCYGLGANGKSTFLRVLLELLGEDYAKQAPSDLLLEQQQRGHPTEYAFLYGLRVATCVEIGDTRKFDEVMVKQLTGGDLITARRMREDFWQFKPTHQLWLAANHKPVIRGADEAIWRRIILIPFTVQVPEAERDPALVTKLSAERAGILAWAMRGCQQWLTDGLAAPDSVRMATNAYRTDMDVLGGFLEARCEIRPGATVRAKDLYAGYTRWARDAGEEELTQQQFGTRMTERGFQRKKRRGVKVYLGLELRDDRGGDEGGRGGRPSASPQQEAEGEERADASAGGRRGPVPGLIDQLPGEVAHAHDAYAVNRGKSSPSSPRAEEPGSRAGLWDPAGEVRRAAGEDADESDYGAMGPLESQP